MTLGPAPRATDPPLDRLPRFELHPEVSRLAAEIVAGLDTDLARASAVESYLQQNYAYSMSGMTRLRSDPITWFLLNERQGHCEYFAGAMVALLTDLGIPARMVAGYSGGALSLGGDEAVVREANAHAWVEASVGEGDGWTVFDPTPEASVPSLSRPNSGDQIRWALDWVQSGWDRYVLTFGLGEQIQLLLLDRRHGPPGFSNGTESRCRRARRYVGSPTGPGRGGRRRAFRWESSPGSPSVSSTRVRIET